MKIRHLAIACFLVLCVVVTGAFADIRPPSTSETQMISSSTTVHCSGTFTESDSLVWRQSNEALDVNYDYTINWPEYVGPGNGDWHWDEDSGHFVYDPGHGEYTIPFPEYPIFAEVAVREPEPPLAAREVQMTSSTLETTLADHGSVVYAKQSSVDTNWKTANMYNVDQVKQVGFSGSETGRISSDESALVDVMGMPMPTLDDEVWQCPFSTLYPTRCLPPFCNIVEMGSSVTMKDVQYTTSIESRSIADVAEIGGANIRIALPVIDGPPTELNYAIDVGGAGSPVPAQGSVAAFINTHTMDGTINCPRPAGGVAAEHIYNEKTTASGTVLVFQKDMHYLSGIGCPNCGT